MPRRVYASVVAIENVSATIDCRDYKISFVFYLIMQYSHNREYLYD